MTVAGKLVPVQAAYDDLLQRSLAKLPGDLSRLIYLASTRDYNSGVYHHDGLAVRFRPEAASKALEIAHRDIFCRLAALSLEQLVGELELYLNSSHESPADVLRIWQKLEPFRVAIPVDVNPAMARLFLSNVRLALAIWRHRQEQAQEPR
jgi:hypothetical protein